MDGIFVFAYQADVYNWNCAILNVLLHMHQQIMHQTKLKSGVHHTLWGGVLVVTPQKPRPNLCPWPRAYNFPSKITILIIIIIIIFVVIIIIIIIIISISFDVDVVHKKT